MSPYNFNEEDKQKFIDFLNMVATHGKFNLDTNEIIQYFKLLSYMQQKVLPKIDAHILEIKRIVNTQQSEEVQPEAEKPESKGKGKK